MKSKIFFNFSVHRNASNPSETRSNENMLKRKISDDEHRYSNKRNNREHESAGEDDDHLTKVNYLKNIHKC
jgi:hypothetical protein